jgi:hypothetical protein
MSFEHALLAILAVLAVTGIFLMRRPASSGSRDMGSVSASWLAEHKSGHQ